MAITFDNISLGYNSKKIIDNLTFKINEGDYILIIGENGTGKSTLVKTILGLIPPLRGSINLNYNGIGYLSQQKEFSNDFPATAYEIVMSGFLNKLGIRPFYRKTEKKFALENMEKMGIIDVKNQSFCELSGGQKQRVLLARSLCSSKELLVLDEPCANLDKQASIDLCKLIKELNKEMTIIMVTHNMDECIEDASHILRLGKNIFWGDKDKYLQEIGGNDD